MAEGYVLHAWRWTRTTRSCGYEFCQPGQDDGRHQEGHEPERSLREEHGSPTASFEAKTPPSTSTRASSNKEEDMKWLCLKATKEECHKINGCPGKVRHSRLCGRVPRDSATAARALTLIRSSRASSPSALRTPCWAYALGAAIALKKGVKTAAEAAKCIGEGLQAFCIPGSVADDRKVGLGHGNLGAMLLRRGDQVLLRSWLATSPLPPRKAPSASPATPTRPARSPCASS